MKVGDKFDVVIEGHKVFQAEVKEISGDRAYVLVPGKVIEFGIESRLTDTAPAQGGGTQVIIDDAVRASQEAPAAVPNVDGQVAQPQSVPPVEAAQQPAVDGARSVDAAQTTTVESVSPASDAPVGDSNG